MAIERTSRRDHPSRLNSSGELAPKIALVMAEARQAALAAVARLAVPAGTSADNRVRPPGAAFVYVRKPTFDFREAMFDAGEITESLSGRWPIGRFQDVTDDTSLDAAEAACSAALDVLRRRFPEETFEMTSYFT